MRARLWLGEPATDGTPGSQNGNLYLLVVGVSKTRDTRIPELPNAANDAADFYEAMRAQKSLYKHIVPKLLTDRLATKRNIEKWYNLGCRIAKERDTLIFFFSGHGAVSARAGGAYLAVPYDANLNRTVSTCISMNGFKTIADIKARHAVMILDTCHSGAVAEHMGDPGHISLLELFQGFIEAPNRLLLAGGRAYESSYEYPELRNGVLTHFLLKGMKGTADTDGNGIVTLRELYTYVYDRATALTKGAQHPELAGIEEGSVPMAVCPPR